MLLVTSEPGVIVARPEPVLMHIVEVSGGVRADMRPNGHFFVCCFLVALFHFERAHVKAHVDVSLWILEQVDAPERLMVTFLRIIHKFCVLHRAAECLVSVADLKLIIKLQFIVRPQLHIGIIAAVEG